MENEEENNLPNEISSKNEFFERVKYFKIEFTFIIITILVSNLFIILANNEN
jgi:hypothetical protein